MTPDHRVAAVLAVGLVAGAVLGAAGATSLSDDRRVLADHRAWVDGTVTAVGDGTVTLHTRAGNVTLVTRFGLLVVPGEAGYLPGDWSSVEPGTRVCASTVIQNEGRPEVARAFAGATCTIRPVARPG